jgi:hypothetical protein
VDTSALKRHLGSTAVLLAPQGFNNEHPRALTQMPETALDPDSHFRAEQLADLINAVLIDQARRHGVDLS